MERVLVAAGDTNVGSRPITLEGRGDDAFAKSLSSARVETKPHQFDTALFALHSPLSRGVILADEVGTYALPSRRSASGCYARIMCSL
jgi:hypothetical protein